MAVSVARYLINEGSGVSVGDDQGTTDLTLSGSDIVWGSNTEGDYLDNAQSAATSSSVAKAAVGVGSEIGLAFNGATKASYVGVVEIDEGHGFGSRIFALATSVGSGDFAILADTNGYLLVRWAADGAGGEVAFGYITNPADGLESLRVDIDSTQAVADDRCRLWYKGVERSIESGSIPINAALTNINDGDRFITILNREGGSRNIKGKTAYAELFTGNSTAQERTDSHDALILDNDANWSATGASLNPDDPITDGETLNGYSPVGFTSGAINGITLDGVTIPTFTQTTFNNIDIAAAATDTGVTVPSRGVVLLEATNGTETASSNTTNVIKGTDSEIVLSGLELVDTGYLYQLMLDQLGWTIANGDSFIYPTSGGDTIAADGGFNFLTNPFSFTWVTAANVARPVTWSNGALSPVIRTKFRRFPWKSWNPL